MTTNIKKKIERLAKDERGNTIIMFGLTIVPAVMLVGGAIDFGTAYKTKSKIQTAADAAVLGAVALGSTATPAQREATATSIFTANASGTGATPSVVVSSDGATVTVTASKDVPTSFLGIAHIDTIHVSGNARASVAYKAVSEDHTVSSGVCLLALDPAVTNGFKSQGTPTINYANCWAHTNSTTTTAIAGGGTPTVTGKGHSSVGHIVPSAITGYTPAPVGNASVVADPFATVSAYAAAPAVYASTFTPPVIPSTCTQNALKVQQGETTLWPGRYSTSLTLLANAKVTFKPGVYIMDGTLDFKSGAKVTGTDVLFYFSGSQAKMTIQGGGNGGLVNLKGRQTGSSYEGFLMIGHPDAGRDLTSNIQGGGTFVMEGMVYLPTQNILITGNGSDSAATNGNSNYFSMIAKSFEFRGNGMFNLKKHTAASNMPNIMPTKTAIETVEVQQIERVKLVAE